MTDEQPEPGNMQHDAHDETGCDTWIPGVPKSVLRARIVELIEALGIDIKQLRGLRIEPNAVYAELYALKDGNLPAKPPSTASPSRSPTSWTTQRSASPLSMPSGSTRVGARANRPSLSPPDLSR